MEQYPKELIVRIRERFDELGEEVENETYIIGNTTFDYTNNGLRTSASMVLITSRQAENLHFLAKHPNTAISRETILKQVWGISSYTNSLALNIQISYLRKALRNGASVQIESLMKKEYVLKRKQ